MTKVRRGWVVRLYTITGGSESVGEVICVTKADLVALQYALKYAEHVGYEVEELP